MDPVPMMKWSTGEQVGWWQYIGEQELEEGLSCDYWPWVEVEGGVLGWSLYLFTGIQKDTGAFGFQREEGRS